MPIRRKFQTVFYVVAAMLVASFLLLNQLWLREIASAASVAHTHETLAELASLMASMTTADASARGYLITGQEPYLEPYQTAVREMDRTLASLRQLTADNPSYIERLSRLHKTVENKKQSSQVVLEVRKKQGLAAATRAFTQENPPWEMDKLRAMIGEFADEGRRLLLEHGRRLRAIERDVAVALTVWGALVLALLCGAYFLFNQDAAYRLALERMLQQKNAELGEASRLKSEFLVHVSHELRTPLNAVIGYTGTLLMKLPGPLTADQERQLKTMQSSGRHLLSLINDLLDVAKIESGKVDIHPEVLACRETIEQVITTLRPLAQARSIGLEAKFPERPVEATTDRRAFSQILINLTNNAIKFTDKGSVTVRLDERNGAAAIDIIDTGIGVRTEDQPQLFLAFEQLRSGKSLREGTGLGLYVSAKLAALIGGRIEFESEFGKGSRFTVLLPKA